MIEPKQAPIKIMVIMNENILLIILSQVVVFKFSHRISVGSGAL
jgi:hypothetical protein